MPKQRPEPLLWRVSAPKSAEGKLERHRPLGQPIGDEYKDEQHLVQDRSDDDKANQNPISQNRVVNATQKPHTDPIEASLQLHKPRVGVPSQHDANGREVNSVKVPVVDGCIKAEFYHLTLPCLVDTGATITCIREKLYQSLLSLYPL